MIRIADLTVQLKGESMKKIFLTAVFLAFCVSFSLAAEKPVAGKPADANHSARTFISIQASASSKSGLTSSITRSIKDFDTKIDSFRIKLKMRLKNGKVLFIEKEEGYTYSYAVELRPGSTVYELRAVDVTSFGASTATKEVFTPAKGKKEPEGELKFMTDTGISEPSIKFLSLISVNLKIWVSEEDISSLVKNIDEVLGKEKGFKAPEKNTFLFFGKAPKLVEKIDGRIEIPNFRINTRTDGEIANRLEKPKLLWVYNFEPLEMTNPEPEKKK